MLLTTFWEGLLWIMAAIFWVFVIGFFIWTFGDIFRRRDLTGWGKAGWLLGVFLLPIIGPLFYLIARPKYMDSDVAVAWAPVSRYGAGSVRMSPAEEIAYAHGLVAQGTITQAEFEEIKQNILP
jgi:Phospholipase_D-nuclease N-terminal